MNLGGKLDVNLGGKTRNLVTLVLIVYTYVTLWAPLTPKVIPHYPLLNSPHFYILFTPF